MAAVARKQTYSRLTEKIGKMGVHMVTGLVVLDPTSPPLAVDARLATRPMDLNGKVLGLLNNSKLNAANLLDEVGELLSERYEFAKVIKGSKPNASTPCPEHIVKEFASSCDVLVTSNGD